MLHPPLKPRPVTPCAIAPFFRSATDPTAVHVFPRKAAHPKVTARIFTTGKTRHRFRVWLSARHHPLAATRLFHCQRKGREARRACSYLRHSYQRLAFESPGRPPGTGYQTGSHSPYLVSTVRRIISRVGCPSVGTAQQGVCEGFPPFQSRRWMDPPFSGARNEKLPLTHPLSRLACVAPPLMTLTRKPLMGLSPLSFSPSALFQRNAGGSLFSSGCLCCHSASSRHGQTLSEPDGTCTRIAPKGFGPLPAGGFGFRRSLTTFKQHGSF